MKVIKNGWCALVVSVLAATAVDAQAVDAYRVARQLHLGGAGRWDYASFDAATQRVFVTRGDHVDVVDIASGQVAATLTGLQGAHGVALAPALNRIFVSNGKADSISVFRADTLAAAGEFKVPGHNPDAIVYDPATRQLLVFNGQSHDLVILNAASGDVAAHVALPGKPEFAAIDGRTAYVNVEDIHALAQIDLDKGTVAALWDLAGCEEPTGLDMDHAAQRIFSVCGNGVLAVTQVPSGHVVATIAIGAGPDAVAFLPSRHEILSSGGQAGTLSVVRQVDPDHYELAQSLATAPKARTMAVDPQTGRAWLPSPGNGDFQLIEVIPSGQ